MLCLVSSLFGEGTCSVVFVTFLVFYLVCSLLIVFVVFVQKKREDKTSADDIVGAIGRSCLRIE